MVKFVVKYDVLHSRMKSAIGCNVAVSILVYPYSFWFWYMVAFQKPYFKVILKSDFFYLC